MPSFEIWVEVLFDEQTATGFRRYRQEIPQVLYQWYCDWWPGALRRQVHKVSSLLTQQDVALTRERSTVEALSKTIKNQEAKVAEATFIQLSFAKIMEELYGGYGRQYSPTLLQIAEVQRDLNQVAFYSQPKIDRNKYLREPVSYRQVDMVTFQMNIGLDCDTAPELVAREIAKQTEVAILKQWRHQSALLRR